MKKIARKVSTYVDGSDNLGLYSVEEIQTGAGHEIQSYSELVSKLARLAFFNFELILLMRGQPNDYTEEGKTVLYPKMYRFGPEGEDFYAGELHENYQMLRERERQLYRTLKNTDYWDRVGRSELARWAILQHYEVCATPLLDVTHSAQVAASFALLTYQGDTGSHSYLYVLGVPQITGSITVSPSQALQLVRLSGVCPPETLRPYFQEGYLLGTYPSVDTLDEKMRYAREEMDCAQRLVGKFRIRRGNDFWNNGFSGLDATALYPDEEAGLCQHLGRLNDY